MIDFKELLELIAQTFFGGSMEIAGIVVYSLVIMIVLAITKRAFVTLVVSLPVTFVFSYMGFLPTELMILLIIVAVIGMAYSSRGLWRE